MTSKRAAKVWHVSERTARRYFNELGAPILRIADEETGKLRLRRVLPIDTPLPARLAGNPRFRKPDYQRELAERRWDGHITPQLKADYDAYMQHVLLKGDLDALELGTPEDDDNPAT